MAPETRSNVSDREQARNDDSSLAQLYQREFGGLLRLAFSMTSSESVSEEIVQDAFVKLQAAGNGVTKSGRLRAYKCGQRVPLASSPSGGGAAGSGTSRSRVRGRA
jgi:hypothetical protein